jgi:hypothetical protein
MDPFVRFLMNLALIMIFAIFPLVLRFPLASTPINPFQTFTQCQIRCLDVRTSWKLLHGILLLAALLPFMPCPLLALPPQLILLMMISSLLPSMQAVLALALSATLSIILWLIVLFLRNIAAKTTPVVSSLAFGRPVTADIYMVNAFSPRHLRWIF